MLQLSRPFFERDDSVRGAPGKDLISSARPPHFHRRYAGRVSQPKVQPHVVVGAITRAAAHLVHPYPWSSRSGTGQGDARSNPVTIRRDADQMDLNPMVV